MVAAGCSLSRSMCGYIGWLLGRSEPWSRTALGRQLVYQSETEVVKRRRDVGHAIGWVYRSGPWSEKVWVYQSEPWSRTVSVQNKVNHV